MRVLCEHMLAWSTQCCGMSMFSQNAVMLCVHTCLQVRFLYLDNKLLASLQHSPQLPKTLLLTGTRGWPCRESVLTSHVLMAPVQHGHLCNVAISH